MSNLQTVIQSQVSEFASSLAHQISQAMLADIRGMSLSQIFALTNDGAPAASSARGSSAAAPAKRGPGRPRKAVRAAAVAKAPKPKKSGRLPRRGPADIQATLDKIVTLLQHNPQGLRSEQIVAALELDKKELPRPIAEGLKLGGITKSGEKRATTYFVGGAKKAKKRG